MTNLPPAEVLAARLEHELKTIRYHVAPEQLRALVHIDKAREILAQLQEAMK